MEKQDFQYDQAGRLSKEDELMMSHPSQDLSNCIGMMVDPSTTVSIAIVDKSSWGGSFENARKQILRRIWSVFGFLFSMMVKQVVCSRGKLFVALAYH
jgi:hypothetical protein